jgi:hypothetical protein
MQIVYTNIESKSSNLSDFFTVIKQWSMLAALLCFKAVLDIEDQNMCVKYTMV